jgi:signal transduction histidine kinase
MLKRPSIWVSRQGIAGAGLGLAIALPGVAFLGLEGLLLKGALALGLVGAGYAIGIIAASRRREAGDVRYILRLREELRASQDHIMAHETFRSLGPYLEIAAHQMRDPLKALQSGVEALAADGSLPESARGRASALRAQMEALGATLRHLASYSLTKPGRAPFNVNNLLREGILLVRHRAEEKRIVFDERYAVVPPVFGPASRVQQAILNVIVNAVEAMPFEGGTIVVETSHADDRVIARVHDAGIGVRPEHLPRVFDPFFTTKPEKNGVGLGLWAAKQTLDLIGADISLKSVPLRGTEVTIRFAQAAPLRQGRTGTEHPPELPLNTAEEQGRRIA